MNRQDAKSAKQEPEETLDILAREAIGAMIEVHRALGPGYLESVYEEALAIELSLRNIAFERQKSVAVTYKNSPVGEGRMDFLVGGSLVVELKAVEAVLPLHHAQVISYLKASGCKLGLLVNFNEKLLRSGLHRIILN